MVIGILPPTPGELLRALSGGRRPPPRPAATYSQTSGALPLPYLRPLPPGNDESAASEKPRTRSAHSHVLAADEKRWRREVYSHVIMADAERWKRGVYASVILAGQRWRSYPMEPDERPAVRSLVPPGKCQFTPEWTAAPLLERIPCGEGGTSFILRFGLPDGSRPMDLSTCACVLSMAELEDRYLGKVVPVVRPYTPISANNQAGCFDLLIKDYGERGWMSRYMGQDLKVGDTVNFKHIDFNVKIQAPFKHKKIGMIAGGSGITPIIQALHAILGSGPDDQASATEEVVLLYGSRQSDDILGGEMLQKWGEGHGNFKYIDVLSHEPEGTGYDGERGWVDGAKIEKYLPPASEGEDVIIFVCGPPAMYKALCGPRDQKEVTGVIGEMGFGPEQVFKF